jgi:ankyrin repeat protein
MHGNVGVAKVLLDGGANVNAADRHAITALRWAVVYNHVDTAKLLLMSNARIHSSPDSDISQDTLHWITANNYVDMADVFLLMSSDIRINAKRNGMTALHVAALNQYHKMAEILVLHGAEIDVRDDLGLAPYHYALKHGSDDDALVRLLQLPLRNRSSPYEIDLQSYVVDEKTRTSSNANRIVLPLINPNFDPPFKQNMTNHALEIQTNHVHPTY